MKKQIPCSLFLLIVLSACTLFQQKNTPSIINTKKSNIYISINLENGIAQGFIYFINSQKQIDRSMFNDAKITINNKPVPQAPYTMDGYFRSGFLDFSYNVGDTETLKITHPSMEDVIATATFPPSPTTLNFDNERMDQFINGTIDSITLSWDRVDCDFYKFLVFIYNEDKSRAISKKINTTTFELSENFLTNQVTLQRPAFLKIIIFGANETLLKDYAYDSSRGSNSGFTIYSRRNAYWTNKSE